MPACVYVHLCSRTRVCVSVCLCVRAGAAGVSLAEEGDKSQTAFPLQSVSARSEPPFAFPKRRRSLIGPGISN